MPLGKNNACSLSYRVVSQPPDPADEVGGDALEGRDVAGAVVVEVGAGREGVLSRGWAAAAAVTRLQKGFERAA